MEISTTLGESAITDSTSHLNRLGEEIIAQKAKDVARLVEMYFATTSVVTEENFRDDTELRKLVIQPVGTTGYTTLIDPVKETILIHKFPEQEKEIHSLREKLPSFWSLVESSINGDIISGYYDWQEVDGSISEKYASIYPVTSGNGELLTIWATTYIEEFSQPVEETKQEINAAILQSGNYISSEASEIQSMFIIIFAILVLIVTIIALLLSRALTKPILSLKKGAEEIGRGHLDYKLTLSSQDELGSLADSFNKMSADLKKYIEELKNTATDNINKERLIQNNLRLYVGKINQAQETERKRIARDLHDETVQDLIVVSRQLEEAASDDSSGILIKIREQIIGIIKGIRRFSQELRPSILDDLGLIPALQSMTNDMTTNYGITVDLEIEGKKNQLPGDSELVLFRIIQEALTNVRKHSQATKTLVNINFSRESIRVIIKDNGTGFLMPANWGDLARMDKLGLIGIQERVQLLGGKINIQSQPEEGTLLTVEIPL